MPGKVRREELIHRLRRIEGQVRGIQRMLEEDRACADTLVQLSAVSEALRRVSLLLAEQYALECLQTEGRPKRSVAKSRAAVNNLIEALNRVPR